MEFIIREEQMFSNLKELINSKANLKLAEEHNMSLAQMSLAFVTQQPFVLSNIIGATNLEQLEENIDSIHVELSKELLAKINAIHARIPNPAP